MSFSFNAATASAQAATTGLKPMRLQKPADWPVWLSAIRMIAQGDEIWDLMNSDLTTKPTGLPEPKRPVFQRTLPVDAAKYAEYKIQKEWYEEDLKPYIKQEKSLKLLIRYINAFISSEAAVFIAGEKIAHPWNLLRTLKSRFAPTNTAKKMEVEAKHRQLCLEPGNQDIDKWLDQWLQNNTIGKELEVWEYQRKRPVRDFLYSVMEKNYG